MPAALETEVVDPKTAQIRRDALTWACKKSAVEINAKIDELLTVILREDTPAEVRDISKVTAAELARILKRRK
jgi:hypothetical protein